MQPGLAPCGKKCGDFSKDKLDLSYDPAIPFLDVYSRNNNNKKILKGNKHSSVYISTIYNNSYYMEKPTCPGKDEWTKKIWFIYIMEFVYIPGKINSCHLWQHRWNWKGLF